MGYRYGRIITTTLILFTSTLAYALANSAEQILQKARTQLDAKSDSAHIVLKIIEASGEVKERQMTLSILRTKDGFKSMIRMTAPADVKDTAVLAQVEDGQDQEWLYMPSNKQVRRITSGKKSAGIMGSELSPEDLDPMAFKGAAVTLDKQTASEAQISILPAAGSEYTKVITTFSLPDSLPRKTDYYKGTVLAKTVAYSDYKEFDGKIQRAQKIEIRNVVKKRGTTIEFSDVSVNPPLNSKDFTPEAEVALIMAKTLVQIGKVSSASVEKGTRKGWLEWVRLLKKAGAESWTHQEIVAYLKKKYKLTSW